ncbi:MAG: cytochrome P450, partial [Candidatus Xenobia bacterium]
RAAGTVGVAAAQVAGLPASAAALAPVRDFVRPDRVSTFNLMTGLMRHYRNPVKFFEEFHGKHGAVFSGYLPGYHLLFDSRAASVRQALLATDRQGELWEKPELQGHGLSFLLGMDNVFLGKGEEWKRTHEVIAPYLVGKHINSDEAVQRFKQILDRHVGAVKAQVQRAGGEAVVDVRPAMQRATLDVALQTLLGCHLTDAEIDRTQHAFQVMTTWLSRETINPTHVSISRVLPKTDDLKTAYKTLTDLGNRIIADRRAEAHPPDDILNALMAYRDPEGQPLSDERLRHEVLTLVLAGHETTATLMSTTLAVLSRHPQEAAKLHQAVDGKPIDFDTMGHNPQLESIIDETLRLYSPAYFLVRRAVQDTTLGPPGQEVQCPKGTVLVMSTFNAHRDEAEYGTGRCAFPAAEFHSDRWLQFHQKMFPFGGGTRVCLGQNMARREAEILLASFGQAFDISAASNSPWDLQSDISVHPADTRLRLKLRSDEAMKAA